jgi:hypothetical protein
MQASGNSKMQTIFFIKKYRLELYNPLGVLHTYIWRDMYATGSPQSAHILCYSTGIHYQHQRVELHQDVTVFSAP